MKFIMISLLSFHTHTIAHSLGTHTIANRSPDSLCPPLSLSLSLNLSDRARSPNRNADRNLLVLTAADNVGHTAYRWLQLMAELRTF